MKRIVFFLIISMVFLTNKALAQEPAATDNANGEYDCPILFPRNLIGVRGGLNLSDMVYSYDHIDIYRHFLQPQGMAGLFGHFHLGKSNIAIRPEVTFIGRADSLEWKDVRYRLKAHYLDLRLPITFNLRFKDSYVSPYLMVAPQANLAYGGKINYFDQEDYPEGCSTTITDADINPYDISVMLGGGLDILIPTKGIPLLLSLEAGYNLGLRNNFSQREILDNPTVADNDRSYILNHLIPGAELYKETRKNRGIELALRIALPLDDSWKCTHPRKPLTQIYDTVFVPDTVYVEQHDTTITKQTDTVYIVKPGAPRGDSLEYVRKDCYSFGEMYAFIKLGVDISDKRMCLFNINFDFDSYRLRSESYPHLDEVAMMMNAFPEMRIKIIGHTDSVGSDKYNENLSLNRSKSVIRYLQSKGIDAGRMVPEGFGEKYPIDTNSTPEGRFHNRRVEIEVLNVGIRNTDTGYGNNGADDGGNDGNNANDE